MTGEQEAARDLWACASTGVVLRIGHPSNWAVVRLERQLQEETPQPPVLWNPDRERNEPNESDPDYQERLRKYTAQSMERVYDVLVQTGTSLEYCPPNIAGVDDPKWEVGLAAVGVAISTDPARRYLEWVKMIACPSASDYGELNTILQRRLGVPEEDVAAASAIFRSLYPRTRDIRSGRAVGSDGEDGNTVPPDTSGDGDNVRGEGSGPVF